MDCLKIVKKNNVQARIPINQTKFEKLKAYKINVKILNQYLRILL